MTEKEKKSRTQIKREVQSLQRLGERLVELQPEQLQQFHLEPELLEAVRLAKRLKKHGAKKRQLQYIGSLMRQVDPIPIQTTLAAIDSGQASDIRAFKQTEKWRDRLVAGDEALINTLSHRFEDIDRQYLDRLIEETKEALSTGKKSKSAKALFRYLKPFAHRWIHGD